MATLVVKGNGAQLKHFPEYARALPLVKVIEESDQPVKKLKRAVAASIRKSKCGETLTECRDAGDFFTKSGLR